MAFGRKEKKRERQATRKHVSAHICEFVGFSCSSFFSSKFFFYDHDFCVNPPASIVFGIISLLLCFPPLSLCMIDGGERLGYAFVT